MDVLGYGLICADITPFPSHWPVLADISDRAVYRRARRFFMTLTAEQIASNPAIAEIARNAWLYAGPAHFAHKLTNGEYTLPQHIRIISNALFRAATKPNQRIIVSIGPRHGKSELCTNWFPTWYLRLFPNKNVILACHTDRFAEKWGGKVRDNFKRYRGQLNVKLNDDSQAKNRWNTEQGGGMTAVGVGNAVIGLGANCFPAETKVRTEIGDVDIATLVRLKSKPRVLSFNHSKNRLEWRPILATRTLRSSRLVRVTTDQGRAVTATADHRFFVEGVGYREACLLSERDEIKVVVGGDKEGPLRHLQQADVRNDLQGLLLRASRRQVRGGMRPLQEGVASASESGREADAAWHEGHLLRRDLLSEAPRNQESSQVPSLQGGEHDEANDEVLCGVQTDRLGGEAHAIPSDVPSMQCDFQAQKHSNRALQQRMRRHRSPKADDWSWQRSLQKRQELLQVVSRDASDCAQAGSVPVCGLQGKAAGAQNKIGQAAVAIEPCHPSHRQRSSEQSGGESGDAVRAVPSETSHLRENWGSDRVSVVERLRDESQLVYDIQVEGTSNFFANDILVHNCLVIDDPIASREQAESELERDKLWDWWWSEARSRLEPGASVVVIMHRWHPDDFVGRLLEAKEQGGEQWEYIRMPVQCDSENDPLGRAIGEWLWPGRIPPEEIEVFKTQPHTWSSMWQQQPTIEGGELFKRENFRYYTDHDDYYLAKSNARHRDFKVAKSDCWRFSMADTALTVKNTSDYTVIQTWDVQRTYKNDSESGRAMFLVDQYRARLDGPSVEAALRQTMTRFKPLMIGIEDSMPAKAIIQLFQREGLPVVAMKADKDKVSRAELASIWMGHGRMFFPLGAKWLGDLETELLAFPNGRHDDSVDCLSHSANHAHARNLWREPSTAKLPANSLGAMLGYDKVFGPKPRRTFFLDNRRSA